jgi:HTH-type transcriptional regulator/antitoxin HigA
VLNRKRPLTLSMIRALHQGLGIPAESLIKAQDPSSTEMEDIEWDDFPLKEMVNRGWVDATIQEVEKNAESVIRRFFQPLGGLRTALALYRHTGHIRSARSMDHHAIAAWTARVQIRALDSVEEVGSLARVDLELLRELVKVSASKNGPRLALDFLKANGIALIIEPHLPGTYLDGAAILADPTYPIVAMTIRYDRLDNFWFTLMHELAHIALHLEADIENYYDDLEYQDFEDSIENEADRLAQEALIPQEEWERSPARVLHSADAAEHLASKLGVHPAIVAGRIRYERGSFKILSQLVGYHQVREQFPEIVWGD